MIYLKPGSHLSMRAGCTCDMLQNQLGRGCADSGVTPLYQINPECPLHANWPRITGDFAITGRGLLGEDGSSNASPSTTSQDEPAGIRQPNEDIAI